MTLEIFKRSALFTDTDTAVLISSTPQGDGTFLSVVSVSSVIKTKIYEVRYNAAGRAQIDERPNSAVVVADHVLNGPRVDPVAGAALRAQMRAALIAERPEINTDEDADNMLYLLMAGAINAVTIHEDNTFTAVAS